MNRLNWLIKALNDVVIKKIPWIFLIILVILPVLMNGCVTTEKGKLFQELQSLPSNKGVIYIYNSKGSDIQSEILINNSVVGSLRNKEYMVVQANPGTLTVSTGWKTDLNSLIVDVRSGQQYYVNVEAKNTAARKILTLGLAPTKYIITPKQVDRSEALDKLKNYHFRKPGIGLASEFQGITMPGIKLSEFKPMYVVLTDEKRKTPPIITKILIERGFEVESGYAKDMPENIQCLVNIEEKWFWDLTSYLLELNVELVNPKTNDVYASAKVKRVTPQGRRGPEVMATEVLNAIFNNRMPPGVEAVPE